MKRIESIDFRFAKGDWPSHFARLERLNFRAAIVGKKGRGKTTLLHQLHSRLPDGCLVCLPHEKADHRRQLETALAAADRQRIVLIDGIERLTSQQRQLLLERCRRGLVATLHHRWRLPTWIHCRTTPALMRQMLVELGLSDPEFEAAGRRSFIRSRGNIREALRLMYDQIADGHLTVPKNFREIV